MKKRSQIFLAVLTILSLANVAGSNPFLEKHEVTIVARKKISLMGYYFGPIDQTDLVVTGHTDTSGGNRIYSFKDDTMINLPGADDPVISPDGKFIATQDYGPEGISIYSVADLLKKIEKPLIETPFRWSNQSMAVLSNSSEHTDYRVMDREGRFADYRFLKATESFSELAPVREGCAGTLPKMSPDGLLTASTVSDQTVIQLTEKVNGQCQEVFRIPMPTGKVSFDYAGKYLAFTVVQSVNGNNLTKSAIYDIAKKEVKVLGLDAFSENKFHHLPQFMRNGQLMIQESGTDIYHGHHSSTDRLVIVDPHLL